MKQLESAEIDIGFCSPQEPIENISSIPIVKDELFLIVPIDHRLAGVEEVDLAEVAHDPFVLFKPETAVREVRRDFAMKLDFIPKCLLKGLRKARSLDLSEQNLALPLFRLYLVLIRNKISLIRIRKPHSVREIRMVWRTDGYMSPAVEKFKNFVENTMQFSKT